MFKKKSSSRFSKDFNTPTTSLSPEPNANLAPAAARPPSVQKVEPAPKPKPVGPTSIVPPGTKRVLVVGKYVVMTADVENCDAVIVQGNLDGNIKAKYVVIMKGGCMRGKVECEEADVAGSFEGMEMIAHHRLTLSGTARVGGTTTYHRLSVHDGAILTGELLFKPSLRDAKPSKDADVVPPENEDTADAAEVSEETSAPSSEGPSAPASDIATPEEKDSTQ